MKSSAAIGVFSVVSIEYLLVSEREGPSLTSLSEAPCCGSYAEGRAAVAKASVRTM